MPKYIVKIDEEMGKEIEEDLYMYWSTVVDAPVSKLLPLKEFKEWYEWYHPNEDDFGERLTRVDKHGTSSRSGLSVDELINYNRAGENESCLSKEDIINKYKSEWDKSFIL